MWGFFQIDILVQRFLEEYFREHISLKYQKNALLIFVSVLLHSSCITSCLPMVGGSLQLPPPLKLVAMT